MRVPSLPMRCISTGPGSDNELQLSDLKKKILRGQMGQKQRGFIAGEATFGYRSTPVGTVRMDKT